MSEYGAILQSNVMELVKCKYYYHPFSFPFLFTNMNKFISLMIKFQFPLNIWIDVEKFKTHRLQLEESIQKDEIERTKVIFYSSCSQIDPLDSYIMKLIEWVVSFAFRLWKKSICCSINSMKEPINWMQWKIDEMNWIEL